MNKKDIVQSVEFKTLVAEFLKGIENESYKGDTREELIDAFINDSTTPDWEICEFYMGEAKAPSHVAVNNKGKFHNVFIDGTLSEAFSTLDKMLGAMSKGWKIGTVRVLSTDKIFCVGNTVRCSAKESHLSKVDQTIKSFKINERGNLVVITNLSNSNGLYIGNVELVEKSKPIFKTEDNHTYTTDSKEMLFTVRDFTYPLAQPAALAHERKTTYPDTKIFKDKHLAETYFICSHKVFSLSDILSELPFLSDNAMNVYKLKQLAKRKLNMI